MEPGLAVWLREAGPVHSGVEAGPDAAVVAVVVVPAVARSASAALRGVVGRPPMCLHRHGHYRKRQIKALSKF